MQIQATKLYDTLLNALLNIESSQIVSIHAKALDQGAALKTVKRKLSDLDKAKIDEQKRAVRSGFDMDILPPDLVTFGKEAEKLLEDLQNHDEKMFMVTILLVHTAPTKQKLENIIYSVNGIANANNCNLIRLDYQQEQGFVSALPLGVNQVEIQRGLTTSGTAIFCRSAPVRCSSRAAFTTVSIRRRSISSWQTGKPSNAPTGSYLAHRAAENPSLQSARWPMPSLPPMTTS